MSCGITVRVINGRNNTTTLVFGTDTAGTVATYSWTGVTRFTLEWGAVVVDTATDPTAIVSGANGEITFDLGMLGLTAGTFNASLFLYSPTYPDGLLLDNGDGYTFTLGIV